MVWNAMTSDDTGQGFKKVVILAQKKKVVLPIALLFDSEVKLTSKCIL
jgi:hypothetical protein